MNSDSKTSAEPLFFEEEDTLSETGLAPSRPRVRTPAKPRKPVTTLTLSSRTCRWPIGDPAVVGFHYCGVPPQSGRPYCDEHDRMSYQAVPRKKTPASFR
jgi:hypothetical protein